MSQRGSGIPGSFQTALELSAANMYISSALGNLEACTLTTRRCVEDAFGILVTRWRILERAMGECPENAEETVKALCVLHNFLMDARTGSDEIYCGPGYADSVSPQGQRQSGQ
ncbi:hypothetical protein HPB49_011163 [Dermacentor silvarum]|uniref:Uncharacterized protein n=1 Tax=Dermacentor silvarum TaxID=543639 RepID=A0ACB8C920_DERSI|nr:hypothetical protein HPB49_011163 [Dermacentor silvarum]